MVLIYADPYEAGNRPAARNPGRAAGWRCAPPPSWNRCQLWRAVLRPPYRRLRYCFAVSQGQETWYYYEDGLRDVLQLDNRVQCFTMPWMNPADVIAPPDWVRGTVWYQILPRPVLPRGQWAAGRPALAGGPVTNAERFGGDLAGITSSCPIWPGWGSTGFTSTPSSSRAASTNTTPPITPGWTPTSHRGPDLEQLVRTAHEQGIRVMLDAVFNHCGPAFAPCGTW